MVDKIEKGFVTSLEEKKIDGENKNDGTFVNRTQTIFEVNGQKFMRTKIVEQKKGNSSTVRSLYARRHRSTSYHLRDRVTRSVRSFDL